MVAITSGKLLITGGSGYIGAWIVKSAVDRGYSVVAAVRTDAQGQFLVNRFPEYHGKVSYVLIPVIEKDGAYDEAVKDVDGIIHAASPVIFKWDDPEAEVLRPAIRGAVGILESAHKYGKNVKRIVLTSSTAAIGIPIERDGKMVRDETVWNTPDIAQFEALGKNASGLTVYSASKTYAEQSSWAWVKEHKPLWDFVTILPPIIWGPYIGEPGKPRSSPGMLLSLLGQADTSGTYTGDCADVRDTADFHVLALEHPDAGGERVLIGSDYFAWQDIYDIFHSAGFPKVDVPGKTTRGAGKLKAPTVTSTAKVSKMWPNFRYHTFETSIRELGEQLVKEGHLPVVSD